MILIAGMLMGFFTPTEIAAVTVLYALLISSLFYRELTWRGHPRRELRDDPLLRPASC